MVVNRAELGESESALGSELFGDMRQVYLTLGIKATHWHSATAAPDSSIFCAAAKPMPRAPPVTMAVRPLRSTAFMMRDRPALEVHAIAAAMRSLPDGRVCAAKKRNGPCVITFANEQGVWRLVSFDGDAAMLRLP